MADHIGVVERSNVHTNTIWIAPTERFYRVACGHSKITVIGRKSLPPELFKFIGGWIREALFSSSASTQSQYNPKQCKM